METTSMQVFVVYGAEELPYRRMVYGSGSTFGITPGTFYDLRTTVVPYTPRALTEFRVVFSSDYLDRTHDVRIIREDPESVGTETLQIFPQNASDSNEIIFPVQLGQGLNVFDVFVGQEQVYSWSVTATHYAKFIKAYAEAIQTNALDLIESLVDSLYSQTATRLLDVYLGDILDLFPQEMNLGRLAQQSYISGFVNQLGSEAGLQLQSSALFGHTPLLSDTRTQSNLKQLWLRSIRPRGTRYDKDMLVWSQSYKQARFGSFARLQMNLGMDVQQDENRTYVEGEEHDLQDREVETYEDFERTWAELEITSEQNMILNMGSRHHGLVQFPGL